METVYIQTCATSLHGFGFGDDAIWVMLLKLSHNLRIQEMNAIKLVSKSDPRRKIKTLSTL